MKILIGRFRSRRAAGIGMYPARGYKCAGRRRAVEAVDGRARPRAGCMGKWPGSWFEVVYGTRPRRTGGYVELGWVYGTEFLRFPEPVAASWLELRQKFRKP